MCAGGTPPMFMAIDTVGGEQQQIYRCYIIKEFKQASKWNSYPAMYQMDYGPTNSIRTTSTV